MGFGESPFPVHDSIKQSLCKNADKKSYLPTQGILALREQISDFYKKIFKLNYSADQIIVALGSKSLIFYSIAAVDGALLLPTPSWVSYQHQAYLVNKKIIYMQTSPDSSYLLTPEQLLSTLDRHFKDKNQQKVLLLNYPSNPTGQSYSRSQLENLVPILRKNN
ncbi:MAG: aminotransferase class I/II-fold pyridoxal phosphate-dependent enzyme, partial [Promethearchaeota archaeon]